jgi:phosphohistidine phosphatase
VTERRIWILRHAKAAAASPDGDSARPLTGRGRRQADSVRDHVDALTERGEAIPSLVLCSPATRAMQTAERVKPAMPRARMEIETVLYDEGASGVISWIRDLDPRDDVLMLVGHNPTLLEICLGLAVPDDARSLDAQGLPTGGLVILSLPEADNWKGLSDASARIAHRFVPER